MEDLLNTGLVLFGDALLAALAVGAGFLTKWIATKIKNERVAAIIGRVDDVVMKVVRSVFQSYVKEIKRGNEDGKLTKQEKMIARDSAISEAKSYLGLKGLNELRWLLAGTVGSVDDYIGTVVEAAVVHSKNTGRSGGAKTETAADP